jgi:hypothetical protein
MADTTLTEVASDVFAKRLINARLVVALALAWGGVTLAAAAVNIVLAQTGSLHRAARAALGSRRSSLQLASPHSGQTQRISRPRSVGSIGMRSCGQFGVSRSPTRQVTSAGTWRSL